MYTEVALTSLELSTILYENRGPLIRAFRKLINYWKYGHVKIALFGAGGTGKTTLGSFLSGELNPGSTTGNYNLSLETEEKSLKGDYVSTLVIPGGQERRIITDWPEIYSMLAEGEINGVINVVSWGHHSFTEFNYKETKYYDDIARNSGHDITKEEFISAYLEIQRNNEIKITKELVPHLKVAKKNIWMVTVVTKQDLWWNERKRVANHYQDGEYNEIIRSISQNLGEKNFVHEYTSAATIMSNFKTNDGDLLIPTAAGYDQNLQYPNLTRLFNVINTSIERSE